MAHYLNLEWPECVFKIYMIMSIYHNTSLQLCHTAVSQNNNNIANPIDHLPLVSGKGIYLGRKNNQSVTKHIDHVFLLSWQVNCIANKR